MPSYSFYLLDSAGATYDYLVASCPTDQAARERAARMLAGSSGVEIWRARRLVGRLAAPSTVPGAPEPNTVERWFESQTQASPAAVPVSA